MPYLEYIFLHLDFDLKNIFSKYMSFYLLIWRWFGIKFEILKSVSRSIDATIKIITNTVDNQSF